MTENKKTDTWDLMYHGVDEAELLLNTKQVSEMIGLATTTIEHLRLKGGGPPFTPVGRSVRYKLTDVHGWIASQKSYASTSDVSVNKKKDS